MLKIIVTIFCLFSFLFLNGCKTKPTQLICVVDMTASIDPTAQTEALMALQTAFPQLQRGDSLVVIPVTSDAATQTAVRGLRFQLSTKRAAYDADLHKLKTEVADKLQTLRNEALAHPYQHSDLLGALHQAQEEIAQGKGKTRSVLVILSDLVQDTPQLHFRSDAHLQNDAVAREWAAELTRRKTTNLQDTDAYVGLLRSKDWQGLTDTRRAALRTFWLEYLKGSGARVEDTVTDGPGLLASFLARVKEEK